MQTGKMTKRFFPSLFVIFLLLSVVTVPRIAFSAFTVTEKIPYSDFKKLIQANKLEEVIIDSATMKGILKPEEGEKAKKNCNDG